MTYNTREEWLQAFSDASAPMFEACGAPIPSNTRIGVGFTSHGIRGKAIGQCWSYAASEDGTFEIFISPKLGDLVEIAATTTHELVHAAVGLEAKHGPEFKAVAVALGLEGKMTATYAGEGWHRWADPILARLGPIPHAALNGQTLIKKKKTYLLKLSCPDCGFTARATASHIEPHDYLRCPVPSCGGELDIG